MSGLKVSIVPVVQHISFLDVPLIGGPNNFNGSGFIFKKIEVVFLPDVPDDKSWDTLPNFV